MEMMRRWDYLGNDTLEMVVKMGGHHTYIKRLTGTPAKAEFSNTEQGQKSLVCIHVTCSGGSIYIINYLQPVTCSPNFVWSRRAESAVLHLYGEYNAAMEKIVASYVGNNFVTSYKREVQAYS